VNKIDIVGNKYGLLTVMQWHDSIQGLSRFMCKCDCGNDCVVKRTSLVTGNTKSCGCMSSRFTVKHGHTSRNSSTYRSWLHAMQRCNLKTDHMYKYYGAKGVTFHKEWESFECFLVDMGVAPPDHVIDRIDPFGNYEPLNCRWLPREKNWDNSRSTVRFTAFGITATRKEWSMVSGLTYDSFAWRTKRYGADKVITKEMADQLRGNV
jgi:hypothetical protein